MLGEKEEIAKLVRTLIDSTCTYTALHIGNEKNRFAYVKAMGRCLSICSSDVNKDDIAKMKAELLKVKKDSIVNMIRRFEMFSNTNGFYRLGVGHSLDIIESIQRRFETGYAHADDFFIRSILGRHHEV
jgi:hypothetical protein